MTGAQEGLAGSFAPLDWGVVALVLVGTTLLGHRMAGRQRSMRDFFLGGRRLPWYAVSASIVATEISAVTYISLPWVVYQPGGNLTYLQIGLVGSLIARAIVGYWLVPAYYEREIYSPYDYVGQRLGEGARRTTTALFGFGGILAQSARVYLTAVVLEVILHDELAWVEARTGLAPLTSAVTAIGVVAVLWTWMGGIATVVWTDAVLFLLFLAGIAVALVTVGQGVEGGLAAAFSDGWGEGKFVLFDFSTDLARPYTFWIALLVASWGQVGPYGCDQLMAQRLFCCRDARAARRAILGSMAAMVVIFAVALVGVGLWAYYREHAMSGAAAALVAERGDRVFPVFITEVIPAGLKGIVIAGAFAAAISSLDSILAALSQTTLSTLVLPACARRGRELGEGARLRVSRALVLVWGLGLCGAAIACQWVAEHYDSILDLALAMAGYTQGALLAGFLLAFLPIAPRRRGFAWAAPLSVLAVFATVWHQEWAQWVLLGSTVVVAALWGRLEGKRRRYGRRSIALVLAFAALAVVQRYGVLEGGVSLPWPWYVPIGCVVALVLAVALDEPDPKSRRVMKPC